MTNLAKYCPFMFAVLSTFSHWPRSGLEYRFLNYCDSPSPPSYHLSTGMALFSSTSAHIPPLLSAFWIPVLAPALRRSLSLHSGSFVNKLQVYLLTAFLDSLCSNQTSCSSSLNCPCCLSPLSVHVVSSASWQSSAEHLPGTLRAWCLPLFWPHQPVWALCVHFTHWLCDSGKMN